MHMVSMWMPASRATLSSPMFLFHSLMNSQPPSFSPSLTEDFLNIHGALLCANSFSLWQHQDQFPKARILRVKWEQLTMHATFDAMAASQHWRYISVSISALILVEVFHCTYHYENTWVVSSVVGDVLWHSKLHQVLTDLNFIMICFAAGEVLEIEYAVHQQFKGKWNSYPTLSNSFGDQSHNILGT